MKTTKYGSIWLVAWIISGSAGAAPLSGAIFTTTPDGAIVNENVHYDKKIEVYLDGGPGPNAPMTAAGLPSGDYVFQVTDPSGKVLLSEDASRCRLVRVNNGVIVSRLDYNGSLSLHNDADNDACHVSDNPPHPTNPGVAGSSAKHDTNKDDDYGASGAIVVQLMPFFDTPNPGNVYKAWMMPISRYLTNGGDLMKVPVDLKEKGKKIGYQRDLAFGPARDEVKTDNFKVKRSRFISPEITVDKFHDKNFNGTFDGDDEWIPGWMVTVTDPNFFSDNVFTPELLVAEPAGTWSFLEETPVGVLQTASFVDGVGSIPFPSNPVSVNVAGVSSEEKHRVVFGNVALGSAKACKFYDADGDGVADESEAPIAGWKMMLEGTWADGTVYSPEYGVTGEDGCVEFSDLYPGSYRVTELFPGVGGYLNNGVTYYDFDIVSSLNESALSADHHVFKFANFCEGYADFNTKGYWHNQNGIGVLALHPDWIEEVNKLDPYDSPNSYFETGAEPFDGAPNVVAEFPNWTTNGTALAEIANFLVGSNAGGGGGDQEQLAQQLLAFIFNVYNTVGLQGMIYVDQNKGWMSVQDIVDDAIKAWADGSEYDWKTALDKLNNNDAVPYVSGSQCEFSYE